jgi:PKD repeat protein
MKNNKFYSVLAIALTMFSIQANAQSESVVTADKGHATESATIDFKAIALINAYNKTATKPIQFIGNRKAREIPEMDINRTGKTVHADPFGVTQNLAKNASAPNPSPSPISNFAGISDNNTSIPPDVNGTVGLTHVMTTLNTQVRISDRNGVTISTVSLDAFWAPVGSASGCYDPKVLYDHEANRWMMVTSCNAQTANSSTLLAISTTADPTAGWKLYRVDVDSTNRKWVDYPSIGFNDKWIVVQMNLFAMPNNSGTSHQIYVWNKADLYAGGTGLFKRFDITNEATAIACPSIHYDRSIGKMYTFRVSSGSSGGNGVLGMRTITGQVGSEVLSNETVITTPNPWASSGNNNTNFGPQLGTTRTIATNDHRMRQVVVRDGKIYAVHTVFLPNTGAVRSSVQWWQFDSTGAVLQRSRIDDPTGKKFYSFPSIAVNKANDMLIGYSSFSPLQYASGSYSFRAAADPINTMRDEYLFKGGENIYFKDFGGTRNRWGDYTNTVVDPQNDSAFWTVQEYAGYTSNTWATWWAQVKPNAITADFTSDKKVVCAGESITFTNTSNFTGSNIAWTFAGGTPATSTAASPTVTYATNGRFKVTLTVDGKVQDKDGYVIVNVLPKTTGIVSANNLCVGKTVTITATQASATYAWNTGATSRSITVSTAGDYYCTILASNGLCAATTDTFKIRFKPLPIVTLDSLMPVNPSGRPVTLYGGSPAGGIYTGTGVSNGIFDPAVSGVGIFNITYSYTDTAGCANTATRAIEVTALAGISNQVKSFNVTPNPSTGILNVLFATENPSTLQLKVLDQLGKVVFELDRNEPTNQHREQLDLTHLAKGVYFIQATTGDKTSSSKFVIK